MNVLLFGVGPLALVGIIVAAFVLVAPGKGAASSLGFQAGPAPSAPQSAASTSASPATPSSSPSARKNHPAASSTASPAAKVLVLGRPSPKPKATPKPTHRPGPSGGVVPHNLGVPNFAGYCQHIGHRTAVYHVGDAVSRFAVFADPYSWQCWN